MSSSATNRHLLRPPPSASRSNRSDGTNNNGDQWAPYAASDVVGLVPDAVHEALRRSSSLASAAAGDSGASASAGSVAAVPTGQIDPLTGLSCLVLPTATNNNTIDTIHIWRHATQTLSEDLRSSDRLAAFVHPEHAECGTSSVGGALDGTRLVAVVPYGGGMGSMSMSMGMSGGGSLGGMASPSAAVGGRGGGAAAAARGATRGASSASLYACTPAGSLAYWTDALPPPSSSSADSSSSNNSNNGPACSAAVQLALDDGEAVTCLTSTSASLLGMGVNTGIGGSARSGMGGTITPAAEPLILLGTSEGRIMMSSRLARPLSLRARQLHRYAAPALRVVGGANGDGDGDDGGSGSAGAGGGGLLNMAYSAASYLMTPGKPKRGTGTGTGGGGGAEDGTAASTSLQYFQGESGTGSTSGIAQILALPQIVEPSASASAAYLPTRPGSPSPSKTRRLSHTTTATGGGNDDSAAAAAAAAAVRFLALTDGLTLTQWRLDGRSDPTNPREGIEWEADLGRRMTDRINAASGSRGGSQGYVAQIKALRASVGSDGRCAAVVFLAQLQSGEVRAYVASVDLAKMLGRGATGAGAGSPMDDAISGPIWLNRHPSESLRSGRWTCGGVSVVPAVVSVGGSVGGGSYVLYSAWHDPLASLDGMTEDGGAGSAEHGGAVATAVLLPTTGGASSMTARLCDADLPPHVFPSLLSGMACPDLLSGGICLAGSTGCIADLRVAFPAPAAATAFVRGTRSLGIVDETEVHTVASHILSTYLSHIAAAAAEGDDASRHIAPGSVPPSIFAASPDVLGPAVLSALMKLLSLRSQQQGLHQSRQQRSQRDLYAPDGHTDASATISFLNTHTYETLPSFVNFLIHAGIYLRVEARDRVKLRDVGEKMMATLALVDRWRDELAHAESSSPEDPAIDEFTLTKVSSAINSMLAAGPVAVAERLPVLFADMQRDILGTSSSSVLVLDITSALLCQAHTCALRYRADKTEDLFKLPLEDRNSVLSSCASWMSDGDLLKVYEMQLQQIRTVSSSSSPASGGGVRGEVHVQVLASALLDGYRDALNYAPSEDKNATVTSYHSAKVLSIPLLRLYDPSDMWPFDLSVDHGYFDGVFDVCHDWTVGSKRFEEEPDAEEKKEDGVDQRSRSFDLKPILEACSVVSSGESFDQQSLYKDLMPPSVDPPTGLTFPQFVLKRYADLRLQGVVLDLGRLCPSDLETFVEEDKRMVDHRWIVRVRSEKYGAGRDGLVDVVKDGFGGQSFSDRELTLSLAKLCNSIDAPSLGAGAAKGQTVDDGLTLLSVQRLLADGDQIDADRPMRPNDLLSVVQTRVAASVGHDTEESTRLCLAGLAVAEVAARSEQSEEMGGIPNTAAQYASPIWSLAVLSDAQVWQSLAEEYAAGASGELGVRDDFEAAIESTVLFGVLQGYNEGRKNVRSLDQVSSDVAIGYQDDEQIMTGLMNQLRTANAANDTNAKALETVLLAAAGLGYM